jgi:hypothetical protein
MLMNLKFNMIPKAIVACCVLHNFVELSEGHPAGADRYQKARTASHLTGTRNVPTPSAMPDLTPRVNRLYDTSANDPDADVVHSQFVGSNVTVAATGDRADAELNIGYASGTMADLNVSATGVSSNAYAEIAVETDKTLTIDTLTVTDNSVGGDTASADVYIYGQPGTLAQDPEFEELENAVRSGTVRISSRNRRASW